MGMSRKVVCDGCGAVHENNNPTDGFPGWCIVQGIGAEEKADNESYRHEHLNSFYCPGCTTKLAEFITSIQKSNRS